MYNNPVNNVDPTGNTNTPVNDCFDSSAPMGYTPPIPPADMAHNIADNFRVDKPTELHGQSYNGVQYVNPDPANKGLSIDYDLCGQLSFAAIYETVNPGTEALDDIWYASGVQQNTGTTKEQMVDAVNAFGYEGWSASFADLGKQDIR